MAVTLTSWPLTLGASGSWPLSTSLGISISRLVSVAYQLCLWPSLSLRRLSTWSPGCQHRLGLRPRPMLTSPCSDCSASVTTFWRDGSQLWRAVTIHLSLLPLLAASGQPSLPACQAVPGELCQGAEEDELTTEVLSSNGFL